MSKPSYTRIYFDVSQQRDLTSLKRHLKINMEIFPFSPRFLLCSFENKNAMFQSGQDSDLSRLVVVKGKTERKRLEEKGDSEGHSATFKVPWTEATLEKSRVSTNSRDTREHAQCHHGYLPSIENQIGFVSRICGHIVGSDHPKTAWKIPHA